MKSQRTASGVRFLLAILAFIFVTGTLSSLPREDFVAIDLPIDYGYEALKDRLEPLRRQGPVLAVHLSGGSARAFAHIGVLRRLEELGVYPQVIVTDSMGSIIGLLYAAGVPLDVIEDILVTIDYGQLFSLKLPTSGGIMDPRGLLAAAQALVGDPDLTDLPIPIVVVCEDLRSMRRVLLSKGSFLTVLWAAIAMPGAVDPVKLEDFVLIDGGITNLVPLEPFADLADFTISSTAFYNRDLEPDDPATVLNMAINIAKSRTAVEDIKKYKPFLIRNDVEQFTYMGYRELPRIVARGYESASARVEELRRALEEAGILVPAAEPDQLSAWRDAHRSRWARIKRELEAGRRLPVPKGFGALKLHPLLLKRYRGANRLEQANYMALDYSYEAGASEVRAGVLGDLGGKWAAGLGLRTSLWNRLELGLESYLFFSADGAGFREPYLYGRFGAGLPLLPGEHVRAGPFFRGELRLELPDWGPAFYLSSGLEARLADPVSRDFLAGEVAWFLQSPTVQGVSAELLARTKLVGALEVFARGLIRASLSPDSGGVAASFNDFYRGVPGGGEAGSFMVLNGELILAPSSLSLSLWELFQLRNLELSVFCDLLWTDVVARAPAPLPSVGASLGGELALIGLLPLYASIAGGYDLAAEQPFFALNLSSPY